MRQLSIIAALLVMAGAPTAFANGARPDNPSGFGKLVSGAAPVGELASDSPRNDDGPGASNEVLMGHEEEGTTPNLPPDHP